MPRNGTLLRAACAAAFVLAAARPALPYWEWTPQTGRWINPKLAVKDTPKEQFEWAESFRTAGDRDRAAREHRKLLKRYERSEYAPRSCMALGAMSEEAGDAEKAFEFYQTIVDEHPGSPLVADAIARQAAISEKVIAQRSRGVFAILRNEEDRAKKFEQVIANDPYGSDAAARCIRLGDFYLGIEEYGKAETMFRKVADEFPRSPAAETALYRLICVRRASISPVSASVAEHRALAADIDAFLADHPQSPHAAELRGMKAGLGAEEAKRLFEIASYYERSGNRAAARIYYGKTAERYPDTEYGALARTKLAAPDR